MCTRKIILLAPGCPHLSFGTCPINTNTYRYRNYSTIKMSPGNRSDDPHLHLHEVPEEEGRIGHFSSLTYFMHRPTNQFKFKSEIGVQNLGECSMVHISNWIPTKLQSGLVQYGCNRTVGFWEIVGNRRFTDFSNFSKHILYSKNVVGSRSN